MAPHILIVGGGLSGLLLGILLERANIPYTIFERTPAVKPLGSVMSLNVNILPVFEQLQLYDELMSLAFICPQAQMFDENMKRIGVRSNEGLKERLGYDYVVFSRPKLYELLLSKVPSHRILFGKKVLSIQHALGDTCHTVSLKCSDNSTYDGDILVGADGAYSAVRQSLYRSLDAMKKLPPKDAQGLRIGYLTLVGTTDPMDDEKMAELKDNFSHFAMVIGSGKPYTWSVFTIPEKRVCWTVQVQIAESTAEERAFRNTEWGPESNEAMIREVSDFSTPFGPLGRFIEATPRDRISKVFLEEKLFETWHSGRTVLIGDAAHKMLPAAGQGAVNAMQDSVILANCLYDIANCPTTENITAAFRDYQEQRFSHVKFQFESSKFQAKILFGQTFGERMLRQVVFGYMPQSFLHRDTLKEAAYQPQVMFLPLTPCRGTHPILRQKPSRRYQEESANAI